MSEIERHIRNAMYESHQTQDAQINDEVVIKSALTATHKTLLAVFLAVVTLLVVVSQVTIDIVVSSRGELLLDTDIEKVQHLEGGILDKLLVTTGDTVYAGQPIARLKSVDRNTQLASSTLDIEAIQIELEKFRALIEDRKPAFSESSYSPELVQAGNLSWAQEAAKNRSNQSLIEHDIQHKERLMSSMRKRKISSQKQLGLIQEQLKIKETLYGEEMASYIDVLNMQVQEMNMLREIENLDEALLNEDFQQLRLKKQLADLIANRNAEYQSQINSLKKDLTLKQATLPQHTDKVERLTVYSPVDGVVDKVHFNYQSAVIPPGESIADIAPIRNQLHGEAKIPRKDLGFVEIGQEVKLKFDTYNFAKYGYITGTIQSISRSSYKEEETEFYIATISMEKSYLEKSGARYNLSPYMEFTADIKTGSRKMIEYALKPVMSAIEDAFDER
ncbi:HlyD family type I secretion periplasmic adaptor subunit [Vibrio sp. SCSIO 43135]|uniref:HlyD family type I secretion periplasmic adaptor subunit n=1 Tax=Vibrio sp. SCSIO 43135 TaxID=2819096 RepID=UPI0020764EEC|nr:HlyD family type I secretion periplasmic adaptor subunit [Vibrio sp. SCSIO 43135]USD40034.1 HlyD family type I secretion periplasmic adaptor subunit [Vibrio sp. SCSIO 43135]